MKAGKQTNAPVPPPPNGTVGTKTLPAVEAGDKVEVEQGVLIEVPSVTNVQVEATGPGDIAGPGIRVVVRVTNNSATDAVDLSGIAVTASYGTVPATPIGDWGEEQMSEVLQPGESDSGVYKFRKPDNASGKLSIRVEYNHSENVVVVTP